jgi:hypothetical protein
MSGLLLLKAMAALSLAAMASACVVETDVEATDEPLTFCGGAGVYSPYMADGAYPVGPVDELPWDAEDFEAYTTLPKEVECASTKDKRGHLDVTAGCLDAILVSGKYKRGRIDATSDGAFRAIALGEVDGFDLPAKWTDQSVSYRFWYDGASGSSNVPGFKAFARYRSEDDLYVAGWRTDGVAIIQRKQCGKYSALATKTVGKPSANAWHWIRLDAVGDQLTLWLDNTKVLTATSSTFGWGTAGIRIDSMDGAYIDDWRVE